MASCHPVFTTLFPQQGHRNHPVFSFLLQAEGRFVEYRDCTTPCNHLHAAGWSLISCSACATVRASTYNGSPSRHQRQAHHPLRRFCNSYEQYLKGWGVFFGPGKAHFLVHVRSLIPCRNRSDLNRHNGEWRLGFPGGGKRHSR